MNNATGNTFWTKILFSAALLSSSVAPAFGQQQSAPPTPQEVEALFDQADTNGNGLLEKSEWALTLPQSTRQHADLIWSRIQPNGNSVTKQRLVEVYTQPE